MHLYSVISKIFVGKYTRTPFKRKKGREERKGKLEEESEGGKGREAVVSCLKFLWVDNGP